MQNIIVQQLIKLIASFTLIVLLSLTLSPTNLIHSPQIFNWIIIKLMHHYYQCLTAFEQSYYPASSSYPVYSAYRKQWVEFMKEKTAVIHTHKKSAIKKSLNSREIKQPYSLKQLNFLNFTLLSQILFVKGKTGYSSKP